jgi:hypothetical protein
VHVICICLAHAWMSRSLYHFPVVGYRAFASVQSAWTKAMKELVLSKAGVQSVAFGTSNASASGSAN